MISKSSDQNEPVVPSHYICPLTLEIMSHPVLTSSGFNFERSALSAWLNGEGNATCPMTRKPIGPSDIISNRALQQQIRGWKTLKGFGGPLSKKGEEGDEVDGMEDISESLMFSADQGKIMIKMAQERYYAQQREAGARLRHGNQGQRNSRRRQQSAGNGKSRNIFKKWARALTNASQ